MRCSRTLPSLVVRCAAPSALALVGLSGCHGGEPIRADDASVGDAAPQETPASSDLSADDARRLAALIDDGAAHHAGGRWIDAAKSFSSALDIDPANERAIDGLNDSLARMDQRGRLAETAQLLELRSAAAKAEFDAGYQRALQALDDDEFELAKGAILQARATLLENREIIPPAEFEPRDARAAELLQAIDRAWELSVRHGR